MRIVTFLDLETTGKLDPKHKIIELSMRMHDLDSEEEIKNILLRFNPNRNIDAKAQAVHGISIEDLKNKPVFGKCISEILKALRQSHIVVAHHGTEFDFPFLDMEIKNAGYDVPEYRKFDTVIEGNFATDLGKNPSLGELSWSLGIDYDPNRAHKGDYDTEVLKDAFFAGVRHGWFIVD